MAFSITCPSCSAKLKTATAIPLGRSVQCPKCKESFVVSAKNMVEVADSKMGVAPAAAKPSSASVAPIKTGPPSSKRTTAAENPFGGLDEAPTRGNDADDEEDRPRSRRRDEDDDNRSSRKRGDDENGPRSRGRKEDEDDRPRSKRRDEEDDDDRPRSRSRRGDDDDDDRPRSRGRRDDDDDRPSRRRIDDDIDDDDRPRRKKKKGRGLGVTIGLAAAALLVLGGVGYLVYSLVGGGGGSGYDTEMLAFLPAESNLIGGADIDELNKNAKVKELIGKAGKSFGKDPMAELNDKLKPAGLSSDDVSRVIFGASLDPKSNATPSTFSIVVRTKKSFDKAKLAQAMEFKDEKKQGDKTYYVNSMEKKLVYFPEDTLIVLTSEKHFETLNAKGSSKVVISDEMQELGKKMGKGHVWVAVSRTIFPPDAFTDIDSVKAIRIPYFPPELFDAFKEMKGGGFSLKLDGDDLKIGLGLLCGSKEAAEKAETSVQKDIDERKSKNISDDPLFKAGAGANTEAKSLMESMQKSIAIDRSGSFIEMKWSLNLTQLEGLSKMFPQRQPPPMQMQPQPTTNPNMPKGKRKF